MIFASWNVNSIWTRSEHLKRWLQRPGADPLLLQELKSMEFPSAPFRDLGYESAAVTEDLQRRRRTFAEAL